MRRPVRKPRETFTREFKMEAVRLLNKGKQNGGQIYFLTKEQLDAKEGVSDR